MQSKERNRMEEKYSYLFRFGWRLPSVVFGKIALYFPTEIEFLIRSFRSERTIMFRLDVTVGISESSRYPFPSKVDLQAERFDPFRSVGKSNYAFRPKVNYQAVDHSFRSVGKDKCKSALYLFFPTERKRAKEKFSFS
uniref:Uncharacterized protein n=1 Tax=Romanomermis culicivorax TaxID=13658 RepID=A0A915KLX4_ROMCU